MANIGVADDLYKEVRKHIKNDKIKHTTASGFARYWLIKGLEKEKEELAKQI